MAQTDHDRLRQVKTFPALVKYLQEELDWPIEADSFDDMTFEWTGEELRLSEDSQRQLDGGSVRQLRSMRHQDQTWGIFFALFNQPRVYATALRSILRGLVPSGRRDARLPAWKHDNLLFVCATADYQQFTFAHFRGEKATTARLATFGWKQGDRYVRTLCEYNLPALRWPEDDGEDADAWIKTWAKAFDKEPLTRAFFKRFDKALELIQSDLLTVQRLDSAEAYSRAQLLLERLLFLYFLQNRGWLNQQRGYLLSQFELHRDRPEEFTYYGEFLETLFWTLASAPGPGNRLDGIPFLNGGLFDDDEFEPSPRRKKENPPLRIRNATFAQVFDDLLEAFNFTVREDTPLNQDVAVDPEMLGKVFESIVLHAEAADPDAVAPDKRKATGSYYTPRIVVHFICREALLQYLLTHIVGDNWNSRLRAVMEIDATDGLDAEEITRLRGLLPPAEGAALRDILRKIKCCDPAVGSGAFPVGLLHELVNLRRVVETAANGYVDPVRKEGAEWMHATKADIVENCLYGVDIQQQAIEICRLRLWLSLVVDYDIGLDPFTADRSQFDSAIKRISQLPNLEMNFRRGDSLLDMVSGVPVRIEPTVFMRYSSGFDYQKHFREIQKLGARLHRASKAETKRKLRLDILRLRLDIAEHALRQEIEQLVNEESGMLSLFEEISSPSEKRKRVAEEKGRIQQALDKVAADRKDLEKLAARPFDSSFYPKLRRLEGADFTSPFNFVWRLDFPNIFAHDVGGESFPRKGRRGKDSPPTTRYAGFDLIVGNPPFVTARNPVKRELYRERWKRVCSGKYLLVCPFFDLSFGLLKSGGQLGFIVSNAFAKREFGKPLVEDFFPTVDLQKVIDCSGLMFPGHGTPTCIVFGRNQKPDPQSPVRVAAILPGGGDLRTPPAESPLWRTLAERHDQPGYADARVVVADRQRSNMAKHPWAIESTSSQTTAQLDKSVVRLLELIEGEVGVCTMTNADDVFLLTEDAARRLELSPDLLPPYHQGEEIRNWSGDPPWRILLPYDRNCAPLPESRLGTGERKYLQPFKTLLENRHSFGSRTFKELGRVWYEFERMNANKYSTPRFITLAHIATHNHFVYVAEERVFGRHPQVIKLSHSADKCDHHLLSGFLNSSAALFWLKQVCFSKRESGEGVTDTYFEFAGNKVQQLPVPELVAQALRGKSNALAERLTDLSRQCWERGQQLPPLAMKKLFEKPGEAYLEWNASLPGHVPPHAALTPNPSPTDGRGEPRFPFGTAADLRAAFQRTVGIRETLRAEMIALQEEMDWLIYETYGLVEPGTFSQHVPDGGVGLSLRPSRVALSDTLRKTELGGDGDLALPHTPMSMAREQRPFCLYAQAEGNFDNAASLIPTDWPEERRTMWRDRLTLIRDNEHVRRIEQPVYKRRWDEQWKVGGRWQCGHPAYDAEFLNAFAWWLSEKAEWWLEHEKSGGPVTLDEWTTALWSDSRVQSAWEVSVDVMNQLEQWKAEQKTPDAKAATIEPTLSAFARYFKATVKDQSVPDNIPWAVPWDEIKFKVPANVKRIRGKLNVPRERFRMTPSGEYVWAGKFLQVDDQSGSEKRAPPFE